MQSAECKVQRTPGGASALCTLHSALPAGFTVLEVLVVIAMIGAVALLAAPFLSTGLTTNDVSIAETEARDALREAQASVMSGRNNARFGVHFEGTAFVLFQGATYSVADTNNVTHQLTGRTEVTVVCWLGSEAA